MGLPDRHERRPRRAAQEASPAVAARRRRDDHEPEPADPLAERQLDAIAEREAIDAALDDLPEEFRVAVVLRDVADLDYAEIAAVLDVPVGTVKSRIARGRGQLAEQLGNRTGASGRPKDDPPPTVMTDHPTSDEQLLLASAYMDGELTAEEQARAEADPVVMSMVEELRAVRRQLAIAAPPDEQRRDAAISAALAAAPPIAVDRGAPTGPVDGTAGGSCGGSRGRRRRGRRSCGRGDGGDDDAADESSRQVDGEPPSSHEDDAARAAATADSAARRRRGRRATAAEAGAAPRWRPPRRPGGSGDRGAGDRRRGPPVAIDTEVTPRRSPSPPASRARRPPRSDPPCAADVGVVGFAVGDARPST